MLLKRYYKTPEGWVKIVNTRGEDGKLLNASYSEGECINYPPLDYLEVLQANPHKQNFSTRIVERGIKEGWMILGQNSIVLDVKPEPIGYTIDRRPGHYCSHCRAKLDGEHNARLHVATEHPGEKSPDKGSPSGYCRVNAYLCTRRAKVMDKETRQHVSWFRRLFGGN